MDRLRNPALWIGFVVFVMPILMASHVTPAEWHDPLLLAEALIAAFGTWFLPAGWNKAPAAIPPDVQP